MAKHLLACTLALAVHFFAFVTLVGGAYLVWATYPAPLPVAAAVAMLCLAYAGRPRLGKRPDLRPGDEIPELTAAARRVAARLKLRSPAAVVVCSDFESNGWRYGLRRRIALSLGHPLLAVLDRRELVALLVASLAPLATEARGLNAVVRAARESLERWHEVLRVDTFWPEPVALRGWNYVPGGMEPPPYPFVYGVAHFVANVVLFVLSYVPRGALRAFEALGANDVRERERSDRLARDVAGAASLDSLAAKARRGRTLETIVQRAVLRNEPVDAVGQFRTLLRSDAGPDRRFWMAGPDVEELLSEGEFDVIRRALDARAGAVNSELADRFRTVLYPSR